jgi:hypothetical protein
VCVALVAAYVAQVWWDLGVSGAPWSVRAAYGVFQIDRGPPSAVAFRTPLFAERLVENNHQAGNWAVKIGERSMAYVWPVDSLKDWRRLPRVTSSSGWNIVTVPLWLPLAHRRFDGPRMAAAYAESPQSSLPCLPLRPPRAAVRRTVP